MPKPIAPLFKRGTEWFIDTSELLGEGCPEYGPYATKHEAEDDRGPVVTKIQARRKLKIAAHEPAYELSAGEYKLAIQMLGKMTKGSMRVERLNPDQRKTLALLLYKWKGKLGEETLASLETLKELLYREAGIDPSWPDANDSFSHFAIQLNSQLTSRQEK